MCATTHEYTHVWICGAHTHERSTAHELICAAHELICAAHELICAAHELMCGYVGLTHMSSTDEILMCVVSATYEFVTHMSHDIHDVWRSCVALMCHQHT